MVSVVAQISAGSGRKRVLVAGGAVKCWGDIGNGQLGDGSYKFSSVLVDVLAGSSYRGYFWGCGLGCGVIHFCWGVDQNSRPVFGGCCCL